MTTLASAVAIGDNQLLIDAPMTVGQIPGWVKIDTEMLYAGGQHFRTGTTLTLSSSATATHSQGATVTYAGRPYDADFRAATAGEGGGGAIAATDGQIVFMDGTDAVGSADLTWDQDNVALGIVAVENGNGTIEGSGLGVQLIIRAAAGDATHVGGELTLEAGASDGLSGGQVNIKAGNDGGGGDGGPVVIYSGHAADGVAGDIDIKAGGVASSASGGNVNLVGGTGATGSGGNVIIQAGPKVTGGSHGTVQLYSAEGAHSLDLSETAGFQFIGGVVVLDGLPTADPTVAGQLWNDAGTLKVSAG